MLLNSITLFFFYTNITHLYIPSFPTRRSSDLVNILTEAEHSRNPSPVSPKPMLNMAIAFVLGGMIGVGLAFLLEYLDNTIRTEADVEQHLDLPVLGAISQISDKDVHNVHRMKRDRGNFYNVQKIKTIYQHY